MSRLLQPIICHLFSGYFLLLVPGIASAEAVIAVPKTSPAETKAAEAKVADLAIDKASKHQARLAELEKALSGATLVGRFTDSTQADALPQAERYELAAVRHLGNNQWLFKARIQYGEHDVTVPLTLPILWAGDTPVITVDKAPVIGLGQFDARVMIYRDHYAGYWSGGNHGGHLFGKVERPTAVEESPVIPLSAEPAK
ncbi:hypothetical protein [Adhaeretor mobilis]|uniref:Uncharacterized protein n=1 Tax=Adhaeretor mobilis TaxID=1930276 RepID=A0A517MR11_9BACT|nr:hypothetical protein [Adhaeretor mobilis]QDS97328.1 hypothetical protein HG15A2_05890 [Adhaeretor mobilis]